MKISIYHLRPYQVINTYRRYTIIGKYTLHNMVTQSNKI